MTLVATFAVVGIACFADRRDALAVPQWLTCLALVGGGHLGARYGVCAVQRLPLAPLERVCAAVLALGTGVVVLRLLG